MASSFKMSLKLSRVVYAYNPSSQEAEAWGLTWIWGQPGPYSKFQVNIKLKCWTLSKQTTNHQQTDNPKASNKNKTHHKSF